MSADNSRAISIIRLAAATIRARSIKRDHVGEELAMAGIFGMPDAFMAGRVDAIDDLIAWAECCDPNLAAEDVAGSGARVMMSDNAAAADLISTALRLSEAVLSEQFDVGDVRAMAADLQAFANRFACSIAIVVQAKPASAEIPHHVV